MTEFSNREKTIILITTYVNHPATKQCPDDILKFGLKSMLVAKDIPTNDNELKDMILAVKKEQSDSIQEAFGFLAKNKERL